MIILLSFRSVAETWRVIGKSRKRAEYISNNLVASSDNQWPVVSFFYPPSSVNRLSDEDMREIYFLLSGAFPSEVTENPDVIHLLSMLSETEVTDVSLPSAHMRMENLLKDIDNETRAQLLHPLFYRINQRDMKVFLHRLSKKGGPARRRDIISAMCSANGENFHHLRSAVNLMGLKRTTSLLSAGQFEYEAVRPRIGWPMVIPAPVYVEDLASVPFSSCYIEPVEGAWVTIHINRKGNVSSGFTSSGGELPEDDDSIMRWADSAGIPNGIFLCDYAEMRDDALLVVDLLSPEDLKLSFSGRRKLIEDNIATWAVKKIHFIDDPLTVVEVSNNRPAVLRNDKGMLTFENTSDELVLVRPDKKERVLRVTEGRVVEPQTGAPPYMVWTVSARDGTSYYPIGELECIDHTVEKFVKRHIESEWKVEANESVKIDVPCFVEVAVDASGWGEYGPYISGSIIKGSPSSGISDVIGVEEIGWN